MSRVESEVVRLTNEFRKREDRSKVEPDQQLNSAARYFADYMARTGRYGHTADGKQPSQRAEKQGYEYCLVSENIAHQFSTAGFEAADLAQEFTQGWIDSAKHRENMLDEAVVHTGVAVARADDGTYYAVQMFGRPRSMQIEFSVANRSDRTVSYKLDGQSFSLAPRVTRTHERCRPPELHFEDVSDDQRAEFTPSSGDRYLVKGGKGKLSVSQQPAEKAREKDKGG